MAPIGLNICQSHQDTEHYNGPVLKEAAFFARYICTVLDGPMTSLSFMWYCSLFNCCFYSYISIIIIEFIHQHCKKAGTCFGAASFPIENWLKISARYGNTNKIKRSGGDKMKWGHHSDHCGWRPERGMSKVRVHDKNCIERLARDATLDARRKQRPSAVTDWCFGLNARQQDKETAIKMIYLGAHKSVLRHWARRALH